MATLDMMIAQMSSSLAISAVLLSACGGEIKVGKADDGTLMSPYLAIGDALAADTLDRLPELGTQLTTAAESRHSEPGVASIIEGAGRVGAQDLETSRTAFKTMSAGMIEYLTAHPDEQAGHTIVHCPMTFGGSGGLWVQREGKVMNPYEGSRMLHCGSTLDWSAELPAT